MPTMPSSSDPVSPCLNHIIGCTSPSSRSLSSLFYRRHQTHQHHYHLQKWPSWFFPDQTSTLTKTQWSKLTRTKAAANLPRYPWQWLDIHDSIWWQSWKWSWLMMTMKIIKIIFQSSSEPHIISNSLNRDSLDLAISKKRWWWWIRGFYGDRQNEEMRRCDNKQCRLDNQAVLSKDMIWRWYIFSIDGNDIVI